MTNKDSIKTTVNGRAKFAYNCVKKIAREEKSVKKNYKAYSKRLMAMIKINGLAATLTFMKASSNKKDGKAYKLLYEDIDGWLKSADCPVSSVYSGSQGNGVLENVIYLDSGPYRAITQEVMEFINWVRRFAEGMIEDESANSKDQVTT